MAAAFVAACLTLAAPPAVHAQEQPPGAPDSLATESLPLEPTREVRFRTEEGSWMSVDVSPDGNTLVLDLLGDLYTLPIEGGTATPLLTGPAFESQPRFSPDGTEIVFVSDRSGGQNLWVLAADGSDTTQITRGNDNLYTSPEWSPDGDYLVASRTFSPLGGAAKPWLFHRDGGSGIALIDEPEQLKAIGAAFDPGGRYIYLAQGTRDWTYDAAFPKYQLIRYDRETGRQATVTGRYGSGFRPAVSPDGGTLVYGSRHEDATGLRARDLATGDERWLVYPVQRDDMESRATLDLLPGYAFTPDASSLVASYGGRLWRVPLDGSEPAAIPFTADVVVHAGPRLDFDYPVEDTPTFRVRQIRDVVLSPDGSEVAFTALGRLYVMDADGGAPRRIGADIEGALFHPAWSRDGETIAAVSWLEPGGGHLWTVPADDGDARRLSQAPHYVQAPAWSPDGNRVVVLRAAVRSRLPGAGGGSQTDVVWYGSSATGAPTVVAEALGRSQPHFRADQPDRIYMHAGARGLVSLRWDGTDEKEHLKVTGFSANRGGPPANASSIRMSPAGGRALARVGNDLYLLTVPQVGGEAPTISVRNPSGAPVPVTRITDFGGEFPSWSSDGQIVAWALGNAYFRYDPAAAEAFADSVEAAGDDPETEEPAGDPVEGGAEAAASAARYQPVEVRVALDAPRDLPTGRLLLSGARLITMRGDEVIERGDILVDGNRIVALGPAGSLDVPEGTEVRDVTGMTITPGFVDTHAHLRPPAGVHTTQPWGYLANLAFGVTTTRDPQTGVSDVLTYADRVRSGDILGPRIYSTGPGVFGNYQAREGIRDLDHARDILKRYSEYYDTKTFKMYLAGNRQQRQWLVMAARELELMPTTEAGLDFQLDLTHAIDGYPGIEHNLPVYPLYRDVVRLFSETKVVNTPTLIVSFGGPMGEIYWFTRGDVHDNERLARFTPHETLDARTRRRAGAAGAVAWAMDEEYVFEDHARFLADVVADGGFAGVGSHGQLQGLGFHWELWMVGSGGMSNHDALRSATIFGAHGIGLERELGSLEPGKLADLAILSRNPLDDLRNSVSVEQVMINGRLFEAETLDEVWPRQRPLGYRGFVEDEPGGGER
ncbi:MAG: amidohydrolase family protein [Gammaproteobacteria bacterium]|nr:amidohydrolase family protein [Gammaproteobacteria bacterium]MDE0257760.1 amidohydrolase family protein [Gammaproteobacteria bacterium]